MPETWTRGLELLRCPHHRRAAASPKTFSRVVLRQEHQQEGSCGPGLGMGWSLEFVIRQETFMPSFPSFLVLVTGLQSALIGFGISPRVPVSHCFCCENNNQTAFRINAVTLTAAALDQLQPTSVPSGPTWAPPTPALYSPASA